MPWGCDPEGTGSPGPCGFEGEPSTAKELLGKIQCKDFSDGTGRNVIGLVYNTPSSPEQIYEAKDDCGKVVKLYRSPGCIGFIQDMTPLSLREADDEEEMTEILMFGEMTFNIASNIARYGSYAVKEIAKNDYRKDLQGAKRKMEVASNQYNAVRPGLEYTANSVIALGGSLEGYYAQLVQIDNEMTITWTKIEGVLQDLNNLASVLQGANTALSNAQKALADAKARKDMAGIISANAQIAEARTKIAQTRRDIFNKGTENVNLSKDYNILGTQGEIIKSQTFEVKNELDKYKASYENQLGQARNAVALRNQAGADIVEAQDTFGGKIETANLLAEGATGAEGAGDVLKYIRTEQYFMATGRSLTTGIDLSSRQLGSINAFIPIIKTAIMEGAKTAQSGGNILTYGENIGEALIGTQTMGHIFDVTASALDTMEKDPYGSWQIIASQLHSGVDVFGKMLTTASPFLPSGILVTPLIPVVVPVGRNIVTGLGATAVEAGKKFADGNGFSAELGSGRLSGVSTLLFGGVESIFGGSYYALSNAVSRLTTDEGQTTNLSAVIRSMAQTGREEIRRAIPVIQLRADASLRSFEYYNEEEGNWALEAIE